MKRSSSLGPPHSRRQIRRVAEKHDRPDIGAAVVREVVKRSGISPDVVEETIFGNAWQAGVGPNPARITAVRGGVPADAPAVSVNVRCGSSLQALIFGAQAIRAGDVDCVLVGGTESTSQIPYALPRHVGACAWATTRSST